ncbi:MAG: GNAT family N-acetyltransferase [Paludibacter sp.]|nr:GNAT family N-acetyltransferase [Paludibacter sp.]MDD4426884.1 GNAT family N-acetyltransferase [Paludibacter sp.]
MNIQIVRKEHIKSVVELHLQSFDGFFLTQLGEDFLCFFYEKLRCDERSKILGAYDDMGKLVGFCAFTYLSSGFYSYLVKKNIVKFAYWGIRILIKKPSNLIRLLRNFKKEKNTTGDIGNYAELLSVATLPEMQGKGIGKRMLFEMEVDLKMKSCKSVSLTTDFENNEKVLYAYKSMGYDILYDFISYPDRKMYRMIKKLDI